MDQPPLSVEPPPAVRPAQAPGGHPLEIWISYVLRIGVSIAGVIIFCGLLLFIARGPGAAEPHTLHQVLHPKAVSLSPGDIFRGLSHGRGLALVNLGLLALILTPVIRVAMTVALFLAQRDRIFVAITATVLVVLILGLAGIAR